jgi:hypothetical protein
MNVYYDLIGYNNELWLNLIQKVPSDIYHLPGYLDTSTNEQSAKTKVAVVMHKELVMGVPLIIRDLPYCQIGFDALSPYGYPGVIGNAKTIEEWKILLNHLFSLLRDNGIISVFIRLHPLLTRDEFIEAIKYYGFAFYHGDTVYSKLDDMTESIWSNTRSDHRKDINRLLRNGWRFIANDWTMFKDFLVVYEENMNRLNANKGYYFGKEYYNKLCQGLKEKLNLHTVLDPNGKVSASGLFFQYNGISHSHLSGTKNGYVEYSPSKLLLHGAQKWYQKEGLKIIHFGGGLGGGNDQLFYFKLGFAKNRAKFYSIRVILNQKKYEELNAIHQEYVDFDPTDNNYFPQYRRPYFQVKDSC